MIQPWESPEQPILKTTDLFVKEMLATAERRRYQETKDAHKKTGSTKRGRAGQKRRDEEHSF
jgi:hypothetical protein